MPMPCSMTGIIRLARALGKPVLLAVVAYVTLVLWGAYAPSRAAVDALVNRTQARLRARFEARWRASPNEDQRQMP
ncbi:MAG: hypothetical protein KIS67_13080 [Verrucomicrobiae bacterium]|nr:hypothetical protein [Verrucomicrobiae bacterium]